MTYEQFDALTPSEKEALLAWADENLTNLKSTPIEAIDWAAVFQARRREPPEGELQFPFFQRAFLSRLHPLTLLPQGIPSGLR
jgi:hypothetical protein